MYLPYGYDEAKEYNVVYYMHGGGGTEERPLGTVNAPSGFKNVIDHAIEDGKMLPAIIVCPTYNNTNENGLDSNSFSLAMRLTANYHNELINDLIPAAESRYATYAKSVSDADLIASRRHRAFIGYSMGSVATWRAFQNCLDYFYYFMPMSCGTALPDKEIFVAAEGRPKDDYFVWISTGTADFAYGYDSARAEKMRSYPYFTEGENFAFFVKDDPAYTHGPIAEAEYAYNGLLWFWQKEMKNETAEYERVTAETRLTDMINDSLFGDFGRLLLPASHYSGATLADLSITWYGHPDTDESVAVVNKLKEQAASGVPIFFDIYTDEEKAADPSKRDTGMFFFKGNPGAKFAVCNAGGGWVFVGGMQDSFPHALELSKKGYNAFAVIYRPGVPTAYEDLGAALRYVFHHADELEVDTGDYSLWGGSAGARMAATLGNADYLRQYAGTDIPQAAAVVMQYTGYAEASRSDAPTYACVGANDSIANWRTMRSRLERLGGYGIPTEFHSYAGMPHGFGLGIGTIAEGWIDGAVAFWESQMKTA